MSFRFFSSFPSFCHPAHSFVLHPPPCFCVNVEIPAVSDLCTTKNSEFLQDCSLLNPPLLLSSILPCHLATSCLSTASSLRHTAVWGRDVILPPTVLIWVLQTSNHPTNHPITKSVYPIQGHGGWGGLSLSQHAVGEMWDTLGRSQVYLWGWKQSKI